MDAAPDGSEAATEFREAAPQIARLRESCNPLMRTSIGIAASALICSRVGMMTRDKTPTVKDPVMRI